MRISDWSSDVCSSDLQKTSGEVERWRGRWAEMQNAALERANVPERVDHRSHQRRGIEQEATVHMGPSATAMERRAERQAMRKGRAYEPVTMVGQHNAGVIEQRGLRQYIERGTEWLRDAGQRISGRLHAFAATLSGAVARDRRDAAEAQRQERLAAERTREQAQERQQAQEREKVAEKFRTIGGQRDAGVIELVGRGQYIEGGTGWLRDAGQLISGRLHAVAATLSGAVEGDRRDAAEAQRQ